MSTGTFTEKRIFTSQKNTHSYMFYRSDQPPSPNQTPNRGDVYVQSTTDRGGNYSHETVFVTERRTVYWQDGTVAEVDAWVVHDSGKEKPPRHPDLSEFVLTNKLDGVWRWCHKGSVRSRMSRNRKATATKKVLHADVASNVQNDSIEVGPSIIQIEPRHTAPVSTPTRDFSGNFVQKKIETWTAC
jgi:hypothetical protein